MNDAIVCKLSPVKILAVSAAPLRELLNFLIYGRHPELLNERAATAVIVLGEDAFDDKRVRNCSQSGKPR